MLNYRILLVVFVCFFCGNCTNSNKKDINSDEAINLFQNTISKKVRLSLSELFMKAVTAKPQQYAYDKSLVTGLTRKIIQMFIPVIMIIRLLVYRTKRFRKPNGFLANRMPGSSVKSHLKQSRKSSQTKQLRKHFLQLHQVIIY